MTQSKKKHMIEKIKMNAWCWVFMALAVGFFVPVLLEWFDTGLVAKFPTLIVCGFVALAAVQAFFAGLILNNISQRDRKDFELDLIRIKHEENQLKRG